MATPSYESALKMAVLLSHEERLRLTAEAPAARRSILELCGLGSEIWRGIDAQEYVHGERSSWNG